MLRSLILACVACILILANGVPSAHAVNQCALSALKAAKSANRNVSALNGVYDRYFGQAFAQATVRKDWRKMDQSARDAQNSLARKVVVSLASDLAEYADATFIWRSASIASFKLGGKSGTVTIRMAGKGCQMADVCISGYGCLTSYVAKAQQRASK